MAILSQGDLTPIFENIVSLHLSCHTEGQRSPQMVATTSFKEKTIDTALLFFLSFILLNRLSKCGLSCRGFEVSLVSIAESTRIYGKAIFNSFKKEHDAENVLNNL